jgi:hypothetical protein
MRKKATKRGKGGGGGSVEPTKTKPAAKPPAGWTQSDDGQGEANG